jgi:GTP-binding protein
MPFVDQAKIFLKAGKGGRGCSSTYYDRHLRHPKPDGGNGGKGGDIIIVADAKLRTLLDFKYNHHFRSHNGHHGGSQKKQGKAGGDCIINVPVGTIIMEMPAGNIIRDLRQDGERVVVAKGGEGGRGNAFVRQVTDGQPGEEREIFLELRLIADAGIIGFPNAGKSTLISRISNATPKVASYPFTTRDPVLGIIETEDYSISIADLPGIIEGAHEGKGLGFKFLRHALRTRFFIHVIDMAAVDGRDPVDDYDILNKELKFYNRELASKSQIIVANKSDLPEAKDNLGRFRHKIKKRVYAISAKTGEGIAELLKAIVKNYEKAVSHSN